MKLPEKSKDHQDLERTYSSRSQAEYDLQHYQHHYRRRQHKHTRTQVAGFV
jgi:hypothetical protein